MSEPQNRKTTMLKGIYVDQYVETESKRTNRILNNFKKSKKLSLLKVTC